jgi:polyhydroxyalkanoate synthase
VAGLATIASPWNFAGYGAAAAQIADLWKAGEPVCDKLGLVPMELLQSGFWRLDPARTISKFEGFGLLPPDSDAARGFVALEDWANDGAPLTYAAGRQLFEQFIAEDLPGRGEWRIGGVNVGPDAIDCPAVEFVSLSDRIVPSTTAANLSDRRDLGAGHVGMSVGSRGRVQLWEPLAEWIAALQRKA